ncbi:hypothetical protein [Sphaerospermopsis torques-reginae]|uniref:Uncharacterized protein n=1 Tax=Sphaerospermopsis torques-reginae ITEP-024 TaxID=984208 RepID=A0ABX8X1B6_9CYAN|nr:hypothetical protein [Sphaerospermopsis torques-reginae]QYX32425.1 hypothetical protein K2F26_03235 [Sphaerospermopsis torques-reginae ITEP-024]
METQRKLNVFVGFRSSTQPTNQDIFDFGEGIVIAYKNTSRHSNRVSLNSRLLQRVVM